MNSLPLVTIGAINFNNVKYLTEALGSIEAQSYQNIELVIVDDCSTDNSVELITNWLNNYKNPYKLILHKKNMGVCATCNDVLKNADGKYISIIATDDIMMPDKIKDQVKLLELSDEDVCGVYSDAYLINEDSSLRYGWFIQVHGHFESLPNGYIYERLLKGNYLPAMSLLIKTNCYEQIGYFDEDLVYEDYDMWLRLSKRYKLISSDYVSVKYRVRQNSLHKTIKDWHSSYIKIYLKHLSNPEAIKQLERIATELYLTKQKAPLKLLRLHLNKSRKLKFLYMFSMLNIPYKLGKRICNRV